MRLILLRHDVPDFSSAWNHATNLLSLAVAGSMTPLAPLFCGSGCGDGCGDGCGVGGSFLEMVGDVA